MKSLTQIRILLFFFFIGLIFSGLTAFPIYSESEWLYSHKQYFPLFSHAWIDQVYTAIHSADPILLYGTDWLGFAHIIIALFFIPVYFEPKRYIANVYIACIACVATIPILLVCGSIRGIPWFHQIIDAMFGCIALLPLSILIKKIKQHE